MLIAATLYVCYFSHLGAIGFLGPDEPRYAWIARDMAETGDWVTPPSYWASRETRILPSFHKRRGSPLFFSVFPLGWPSLRKARWPSFSPAVPYFPGRSLPSAGATPWAFFIPQLSCPSASALFLGTFSAPAATPISSASSSSTTISSATSPPNYSTSSLFGITFLSFSS